MPAGQLVEVEYEDLASDPVGTARAIYEQLGIEGFEQNLAPQLQAEAAAHRGYQTNAHAPLPPPLRDLVSRRWRAYTEAWGYEWSK